MEQKAEQNRTIDSGKDIVSAVNREIMDRPVSKKDIKEVTENEIAQANAMINPDPESLDDRG